MTYTGSCACEAVQIRISGKPLTVRQCWCRHCQKLASGGPTHNAIFMTKDVAVTGDIASNSHQADSGNSLHWSFCPQCGTQLFGQSSARPEMRAVRIGTIDQPHDLTPTVAIWTSEAPDWAILNPAMEQHVAQPPTPAKN